jgi:hypothetical protein
MNSLLNTYLGLVGLGVLLFYVFRDPQFTESILTNAGGTVGDFTASLQGR